MNVVLPTEPSNVTDRKPTPLAQRVFMHGHPKVGKSWLAANWSPQSTLFLDLQHGTDLIPGDHFVIHCDTWTDFSQACTLIGNGGHKFHTVVIDTVDQAYKFADAEAGKLNGGRVAAGLVDYGKGTAHAEGLFRQAVGNLLARRGMGVWFIGHSDLESKDNVERMVPKLDKRVRQYVAGECEHIFVAEKLGKHVQLHTQPSGSIEAGSRLGLPSPLPMDAKNLFNEMQAAIDRLTGKDTK